MVGDYECIKNIPYQTSIKCLSEKGQVLVVEKADFLELETVSEDYWNDIVQESKKCAAVVVWKVQYLGMQNYLLT